MDARGRGWNGRSGWAGGGQGARRRLCEILDHVKTVERGGWGCRQEHRLLPWDHVTCITDSTSMPIFTRPSCRTTPPTLPTLGPQADQQRSPILYYPSKAKNIISLPVDGTLKASTHPCFRYTASLPKDAARRGAGERNASRSIPPSKPAFPARKPALKVVLDRGECETVGESMSLTASTPRVGHSPCNLRHFVNRSYCVQGWRKKS